MLTTYTKSQLAAQWRLRRGLEPSRGDVTLEYDGVDTERLDEAEMTDWWHEQTAHAPAELLGQTDAREMCSLKAAAGGGCVVELVQTTGVRRIVRIRLKGWKRDGLLVDEGSHEAELQRWEYTQAGAERPVAVVDTPHRIECFPAGDAVECLQVIGDGDGSSFTMDSSLLGSMASWRSDMPGRAPVMF